MISLHNLVNVNNSLPSTSHLQSLGMDREGNNGRSILALDLSLGHTVPFGIPSDKTDILILIGWCIIPTSYIAHPLTKKDVGHHTGLAKRMFMMSQALVDISGCSFSKSIETFLNRGNDCLVMFLGK